MDIGVPLLELGKFNVEPLMHDIIAKHYPPGVRLFAQWQRGCFRYFLALYALVYAQPRSVAG